MDPVVRMVALSGLHDRERLQRIGAGEATIYNMRMAGEAELSQLYDRNGDTLRNQYPVPPGPPLQVPPLADPNVMPRTDALRQRVEEARARFEELQSSELSPRTASTYLNAFADMLCVLEKHSLADLLTKGHPEQSVADVPACRSLPGWMLQAAQDVLSDDHRHKVEGDRSEVMQRLAALHLPLRKLVIDGALEHMSTVLASTNLVSSLTHVLGWAMHRTNTPKHYRSPVWLHDRLRESCEELPGVSANLARLAIGKLMGLVRVSDEHWHPDHPSLLVQALLVPGDLQMPRAIPYGDPSDLKRATTFGVQLVAESSLLDTRNLPAALKHLIDQSMGLEVVGTRAMFWPQLTDNRIPFDLLREQMASQAAPGHEEEITGALNTVALWMRHHEVEMGPADAPNPVQQSLTRHADPEQFLASVQRDLAACRNAQVQESDALRLDAAQARLEQLESWSLKKDRVREAFVRLHAQNGSEEVDEAQEQPEQAMHTELGEDWQDFDYTAELEAMDTVGMLSI